MNFVDDVAYYELPHFGVWQLNIPQAAALTVKCLWLAGLLNTEVQVPEKESYDLYDHDLDTALVKQIAEFELLLLSAISNNTLQTVRIARDLSEKVSPDETFVSNEALLEWLEERGIDLASTDFYQDYIHTEGEIAELTIASIKAARIKIKQDGRSILSLEKFDAQQLIIWEENQHLKSQLAKLQGLPEAHKLISERQQGAYLNIIGALLGLLLGKSSSGKPYSDFKNQQSIIDAIHGNFGNNAGLSKRNLESKFALARRTLDGTKNSD